jgi:hypothetical protein
LLIAGLVPAGLLHFAYLPLQHVQDADQFLVGFVMLFYMHVTLTGETVRSNLVVQENGQFIMFSVEMHQRCRICTGFAIT